MIAYRQAPDIEERVRRMVEKASLTNVDPNRVRCVRSFGSKSRHTNARIHSASKAFLTGLGMKPVYVIELIAERFDRLREVEKDRVLLHELLHIPKSFGGGLLGHGREGFDREVELIRRMMRR